MAIISLDKNWSFSEIGEGEGTEDGEWLQIESIPTTVHVELLKAKRIPDPVHNLSLLLGQFLIICSSWACMSGMSNARLI
jgi:hypothetical protein